MKFFKRINFMYRPLRKAPLIRMLPTFLQKFITLLVSISILLGTPGLVYFFNPFTKGAEAAWYDDAYAYRQRIDITGGSASQTNYQTLITIATNSLVTANKLQSDCDDIRITDANGKLLKAWLEQGCNTGTTKIWFKTPSIATTGATAYIYYGNPSASSYWQIDQVFDTNNSLTYEFNTAGSQEGWTTGNVTSASVANGVFSMTASSTDPQIVSPSGLSITASSSKYIFVKARITNASVTDGFYWITNLSASYDEAKHAGSSSITHNGSWQIIAINVGADTDWANTVTQLRYDPDATNASSIEIDWIRVHNSGSTMPSTSVGNEQQATGPIAYWKLDDGNSAITQNSNYQSSSTVTNMLLDPTNDGNSWSMGSGHSTLNEKPLFGGYSIKAVVSAQSVASTSSCITVSPSTAYTYSAWIYRVSGYSGSTSIDIIEYQTTNCGTQVLDGVNPAVTTTDTWIRDIDTITTNASTNSVKVRFVTDGPSTGTAYFDGAQFETGSLATTYCDGTLTGNGSHTWNGSAFGSTSTCSQSSDGMTSAAWKTDDQCISGKCLYFDGSQANVSAASVGTISKFGSGDLSISTWVKINSGASQNLTFVTKRTSGGNGIYFGSQTTSTILFFCGGCGTGAFQYTTSIRDGRWHNLVATRTSAGAVAVYVDGVSVGSGSGATNDISNTQNVYIGKDNQTSDKMIGYMDEVKLYNYVLTTTQVQTNFNTIADREGVAAKLGINKDGSQGALSNGLVAYYKMDESSWSGTSGEIKDSSGNSNNGTAANSATTTAGKFGNAGSFSAGSATYASVSSISGHSAGSSVTLAGWVKLANTTSFTKILFDAGTGNTLRLSTSSTSIFGNFGNGSSLGSSYATSTTLSAGTWYHVALVLDTTKQKAYIYLNGVQESTGTDTTNIAAVSSASIGDSVTHNFTYNYSGNIDELRLYNRALSSDEVKTLYSFAPGPMLQYQFEEKSGISIQDNSGNGYTGIANGTPVWKSGKYGSALQNNGASNYISKLNATAFDFDAKDFTVEAWIKPVNGTGDVEAGIACLSNGSAGTTQWCLLTDNDDYAMYTSATGSWTYTDGAVTNNDVDTNWVHLAGVVTSGSSIKLYKNGVLVASDTSVTADLYNPASPVLWIGRGPDHGYFNGLIDDVRVYNYARNSSQVTEDMNGGHPLGGSPVGSPVLQYKFNEGYFSGGSSNQVSNSGSGSSTYYGIKYNGVTWNQNGKNGRALTFDGVYSQLVVQNSGADLRYNGGDLSLSIWIKPNASDNGGQIISKPWNGNGAYNYILSTTTGGSTPGLQFSLSDGASGNFSMNSSGTITAGQWTHVAVTVEGATKRVIMYINGVLNNSSTHSITTWVPNAPGDGQVALVLGCIYPYATTNCNGSSNSNTYMGDMDEVKIYHGLLTPEQVKIDMNFGQSQVLGATSDNSSSSFTSASSIRDAQHAYCIPGDSTSCAAPVGEWNFEEASYNGTSGEVKDVSSSVNNGTFTGTLTNLQKPGKLGKAGNFNGSNNNVSIGNTGLPTGTTARTLEAWAKTTSASLGEIFSYGTNSSGQAFIIGINGSSGIFTSNWAATNLTTTATANNGVWHHIVVTYDGSTTATIYMDGIRLGTQTITWNTVAGTAFIGSRIAAAEYFNGQIDQVRIFNYARSAAQVAWDYNQGAPVAWWKFDECQGATINDSSGNGNTGTWSGASSGVTNLGTCAVPTGAWYNGANGKRNASLSFDGSNDFITTTQSSSSNTFTWNTWVYPTSVSSDQMFLGPYVAGGISSAYYFRINSSKAFVSISTTVAQRTLAGNQTLSNNTWYLLTAVYDGTKLYLYVNGVLDATGSVLNETLNPWGIGRIGRWTDGDQRPFFGKLDDIRLYNYAMTPTQIKTLYSNGAVSYIPVTGTP